MIAIEAIEMQTVSGICNPPSGPIGSNAIWPEKEKNASNGPKTQTLITTDIIFCLFLYLTQDICERLLLQSDTSSEDYSEKSAIPLEGELSAFT